MKRSLLCSLMLLLSVLGHSEDSSFFLSSDKIVQETQGSLKELSSFVFFPLLKMEAKRATKIVEFINQELKKVGVVIKKPVLTPEGAHLESFSNPRLQFTVEQLVDQGNSLLPVLQATLSLSSVVELGKTKELTALTTNRWSVYLPKIDDVQTVIKKTLPALLSQFTADFERTHANGQKPTFLISYDDSWWKS